MIPGSSEQTAQRGAVQVDRRGADQVLGARLRRAVRAPVPLGLRGGSARQMDRDAAVASERAGEGRSQDVVGAEHVDLNGAVPLMRVARRQRRQRPDHRGRVDEQLQLRPRSRRHRALHRAARCPRTATRSHRGSACGPSDDVPPVIAQTPARRRSDSTARARHQRLASQTSRSLRSTSPCDSRTPRHRTLANCTPSRAAEGARRRAPP